VASIAGTSCTCLRPGRARYHLLLGILAFLAATRPSRLRHTSLQQRAQRHLPAASLQLLHGLSGLALPWQRASSAALSAALTQSQYGPTTAGFTELATGMSSSPRMNASCEYCRPDWKLALHSRPNTSRELLQPRPLCRFQVCVPVTSKGGAPEPNFWGARCCHPPMRSTSTPTA